MKKQTTIPAAVLAAAVIPTLGFGGLASATTSEYISVYGGELSESCYIYDESASSFRTPCDESYGSYDLATGTLTLGSGVNAAESVTVNLGSTATITSNDDINIDQISIAGSPIVDLKFGEYSFVGNLSVLDSSNSNITIYDGEYHFNNLRANLLTIDGGFVNANSYISSSGNFTLNNGFVSAKTINSNDIVINGGEIKLSGDSEYFGLGLNTGSTGGIEINGGDILIEGYVGISSNNTDERPIKINGGTIDLKSSSDSAGAFGIASNNGGNIEISGGDITIDGFEWGISGQKNKIYFNGGTTTIKNSSRHSVWITDATDPENDIVFGANMGIKEDTYVFYNDDSTGIAAPEGATVASGYTYRKHYGWEINDEEDVSPTVPDTSDAPKTPDTGAFSDTLKNATLIAISLSSLVTISIAAYLATYIFNRRSSKVKFNRNDRLDD